jgi:hypothetical protein
MVARYTVVALVLSLIHGPLIGPSIVLQCWVVGCNELGYISKA